MNIDVVKDFVKSKKGKAMIIAVVGGVVLHFFPGASGEVAQWSAIVADVLTGVADKVDPAAAATVIQPQ